MAARATTTRRPARPRKDPASLEARHHAAALDVAREPILRIGQILADLGEEWFGTEEFDRQIGPNLVHDVVAMIYAAGFGNELAAAVLPYLVAESSADGPNDAELETAKRLLERGGGAGVAGARLQQARYRLRKEVVA